MMTDQQVKELRRRVSAGEPLYRAAHRCGMTERTARRYLKEGKMPSELRAPHTWRTREDPFDEVWEELRSKLAVNPGLQAKTLFLDLIQRHPGRFSEGQLRTLQRRLKRWRALEGPGKEVFFPQRHEPGRLCQSDFTHMTELCVTINGVMLRHLVYHFVLTYSNWETFTLCFSESFESLSHGLQNALFELGGVPERHRSDRLTAAVHNMGKDAGEFTSRYRALLSHYGMVGERIQAAQPNENGDVEQRHYRFKEAVNQRLMLRGDRDFPSLDHYVAFLREVTGELNRNRREKFAEELKTLARLPSNRLETTREFQVTVTKWSTINVERRLYSVHSRLIGEKVTARVTVDTVSVLYHGTKVDEFERLSAEGGNRINYRHIIDWLVRKPGAFERYRYRDSLFPTSYFRMAYDSLSESKPSRAVKEYLGILELAAKESEAVVNAILKQCLSEDRELSLTNVKEMLVSDPHPHSLWTDVAVTLPELSTYDQLLSYQG